jgi:hypothetical protein
MRKIYEVNDGIRFSEFAFTNKAGGTGLSNWEFNEKFEGIGEGIVVKAWHDYECGWRYHCIPFSEKLCQYMERNADPNGEMLVYVSEFDTVP